MYALRKQKALSLLCVYDQTHALRDNGPGRRRVQSRLRSRALVAPPPLPRPVSASHALPFPRLTPLPQSLGETLPRSRPPQPTGQDRPWRRHATRNGQNETSQIQVLGPSTPRKTTHVSCRVSQISLSVFPAHAPPSALVFLSSPALRRGSHLAGLGGLCCRVLWRGAELVAASPVGRVRGPWHLHDAGG